jgi:diaminopimelate epimerase
MHAAGNDFILIDNRGRRAVRLSRKQKRGLCTRKTGIGADGILVLEKDRKYPFMMRYYNADGGEAALCGNGMRCVAWYAFSKGLVPAAFTFRSASGTHTVSVKKNGSIEVSLPPCVFHKSGRVTVSGRTVPYAYATVGVPHIIIFTTTLSRIDVMREGKRIRDLKRFHPHGTNVNFAMVVRANRLRIRTYERGVENETLACGTGVAATAAVAFTKGLIVSPVTAETASGETIRVKLKKSGDTLLPHLIGKAHFVFLGDVIIP